MRGEETCTLLCSHDREEESAEKGNVVSQS